MGSRSRRRSATVAPDALGVIPTSAMIEATDELASYPGGMVGGRSGDGDGDGGDLVLVVDDDDDIRSTVAAILTEEGYRVTSARSAEEALALLGAGLLPRVVIMDLGMRIMTGFEAAEVMAADHRLADVPVVVMTASRPALPHPPNVRVLLKPMSLESLLEAVRAVSPRR